MIGNSEILLNSELDDYRSPHKQMRIFAYEEHRRSRDILSVAYSLFQLEKAIQERKITHVTIGRFLDTHSNELRDSLSELISYVLLEKVQIQFQHSNKRFYKKKYDIEKKNDTSALVLFSGGIDSLAGILWSWKHFERISALFCAHADQAWTIRIVKALSHTILPNYTVHLKTMHVPRIRKGSYSQLRGFLYILSAGAWLDILDTDKIVLSECGPTMYQPRFGPYDHVTMTTHPVVVEIAKRILEMLLGRKIQIYMPFEDMTKAEVISFLADDIDITETHSCVTQRFGDHDGTCYGCVIRRLGSLVTNTADVTYNKNPLIDQDSNQDNLLSLLLFSQDLLLDYDSMPLYQIENIDAYQKYDLFERFSLDNFAAVHFLKSKGVELTTGVEKIYRDYIHRKGTAELEQRIFDVRHKLFQINENAR